MAVNGEQAENEDIKSRFFYEIARWRLEEQSHRADSLDRKLGETFTLNGALIAVFAAAFAFREGTVPATVWWMFAVVVSLFIQNGICTYAAYQLREWQVNPNLVDLERVTRRSSRRTAEIWTAREMRRAYRDNEIELLRKSCWWRWAFAIGMLDIGLAAATAVVALHP